jgi:chemotaxis protein methyltransferase WspC
VSSFDASALMQRLQVEVGFCPDSVLRGRVVDAVLAFATASGDNVQALAAALQPGHVLWQPLLNTVVVPETWFCREDGAFKVLASNAVPAGSGPLRLLCAPCSTGEEALSMALTLRDRGWGDADFVIDAIDISELNIDAAKQGLYRRHALRGTDAGWQERHFEAVAAGAQWRLRRPVAAASLRFHCANVFQWPAAPASYDVVFCRNLLIYLQPEARRRLLQQVRAWCVPDGWLFVGHAETQLPRDAGLQALTEPMSFGFRNRSVPVARRAAPVTARAPARPPLRDTPAKSPGRRVPRVDGGTATPGGFWREAVRLANSGQLDKAAQSLTQYQRDSPDCPNGHALRGELWLAAGDLDAAHRSLHKALYLQPDHVRALTTLLALASRRGDAAQLTRWRERLSRAQARAGAGSGDDLSEDAA